MKFHVEPVSPDVKVPPHPMEGPMPAEGGAHWIADQYTLCLLRDGVIRRVEEKAEESAPEPEAAPVETQAQSPAAIDPVPAELKADPAPGTVASVPFMITASDRRRLKALGKSDDEIRSMKPEDAQAILTADSAPAAPVPQEA